MGTTQSSCVTTMQADPRQYRGSVRITRRRSCWPLLSITFNSEFYSALYLFSGRTELAPHEYVFGLRGGLHRSAPASSSKTFYFLLFQSCSQSTSVSSTRGPETDKGRGAERMGSTWASTNLTMSYSTPKGR